MLPVKAGSLKLTEESKQKLDLYYRRFCEGNNKEMYGISHIIYACHVSFPLIISPELANLTWLNYNTYLSNGKLQKIDRIVVSDFLLSPLVRPVANRQFEVIPEIRNYLLYLLKDCRWFNLFGIENFGEKRLNSLAQFLRQYLLSKKSKAESNTSGFKEINEWTTLSYLEPDLLAFKMAETFQKTFENVNEKNEKVIDEHGQLRLNMLMDRFDQQINLNIHAKEPGDTKAFINLHTYSKANKARLFEKGVDEIYGPLKQLDEEFINDTKSGEALIRLPFQKSVGERLERKKKNIQRVEAIFIAIDEYEDTRITRSEGRVNGANLLLKTLTDVVKERNIELSHKFLFNEGAKLNSVIQLVENSVKNSLPEDIIVFYLAGEFLSKNNMESFLCYEGKLNKNNPDKAGMFFTTYLLGKINSYPNRGKIITLIDGNTNGKGWFYGRDIVVTATRGISEKSLASSFSEGVVCIFPYVLSECLNETGGLITYNDLLNLIRHKTNVIINNSNSHSQRSMIWADIKDLDMYFLSSVSALRDNYFLIAYNKLHSTWQVIEEDFRKVILNSTTKIYNYDNGKMIDDVNGEIFIRENILRFAGKSEELNKKNIYKAKTDIPILYLEIINKKNNTPPNEVLQGNLLEGGNSALRELNGFSNWVKIELIQSSGNIHSSTHSNYKNKEKLQLLFDNDESGLRTEMQYFPSDSDNLTSQPIKWNVYSDEAILESIKKFIRYNYFSTLSLPDRNNSIYSPFKSEIYYWWTLKNGQHFGARTDQTLMINDECINVSDGQISFNPFSVEISTEESFPIYYEVYLVTSDFMIKKITTGVSNIVEPGKVKEVIKELKEDIVIERVLLGEITAQVKILMSRDPILFDFSQTAIK